MQKPKPTRKPHTKFYNIRADAKQKQRLQKKLSPMVKGTRILNMKAGAGLFAYIIQAIGFLYEFRNDQVILKMDNKHFYYDKSVAFTDNVWEYYFDQTGIVEGEVIEYDNHFADILRIYTHDVKTRFNEDFFKMAHSVFCDKIKIRREILNKANEFHKKHMEGMNILSVHKRNYFHYTPPQGHIVDTEGKLSIDYYLQCVDNKFEKYDKIFLLTDEEEAYDAFKKKYNGDLIHYDSKMSPRGEYILDKEGGYKLGEDVLIEVLLASRTNHLICGTSNVSVGIRIINDQISFDIVDTDVGLAGRRPRSGSYNANIKQKRRLHKRAHSMRHRQNGN